MQNDHHDGNHILPTWPTFNKVKDTQDSRTQRTKRKESKPPLTRIHEVGRKPF